MTTKKNKQQKKNTKQAKPKTAKQQVRPAPSPRVQVHPCLRDYVASVLNPYQSKGACVPLPPGLDTLKQHYFAKGTMYTGTQGFGFVAANTRGFQSGNGVGFAPVASSTATYSGSSIQTDSVANVNASQTNATFSSSDFGSGVTSVQARIVSCGLRMRYVGTNLNMGGVVYALEHPNHETLAGFDKNAITAFDRAKALPVSRKWQSVTWKPILPREYEFNEDPNASNALLMALIVEAPDPTVNLAFEFEYSINVEIIGTPARGKTPTNVEPDATYKVLTFLRDLSSTAVDKMTPDAVLSALQYTVRGATSMVPLMEARRRLAY